MTTEPPDPTPAGAPRAGGGWRDLLAAIRPSHWIKNLFVFVAPLFGRRLNTLASIGQELLVFAAFCALASAGYIVNDILDREDDARHPRKRLRPFASGRWSAVRGAALASILAAAGISLALAAGREAAIFAGLYLLNSFAYSFFLKDKAIVDVISITLGFLLRILAGAVALGVGPSRWLIVCTFCLCLFLGFGKRRCEVAFLGQGAREVRPVQAIYTASRLDHLLAVTSGLSILAFMLYATAPETEARLRTDKLIYSSIFVIYALLRFFFKAQEGKHDGPVEIFLGDRVLILTVLLWIFCSVFLIYNSGELPMIR